MNHFSPKVKGQAFIFFSTVSLPSFLLPQASRMGVVPSGYRKGQPVGFPESTYRFSTCRCPRKGRKEVDSIPLYLRCQFLTSRFKTAQETEGKMEGLSSYYNKHIDPGAFPLILGFVMTCEPNISSGCIHLL